MVADGRTKSFDELSAELREKDPEFRRLDEKCKEFDRKISEFDGIYYITSAQEQEIRKLRRLKIEAKNEMYWIIRRYEDRS